MKTYVRLGQLYSGSIALPEAVTGRHRRAG